MTVERRRMSRNRILQGAVEILDAGVYGDLTVDALARSLHMSKSTLYKYFATKDEVVVAMVEDVCSSTEAALERLDVDHEPAQTALVRIVALLSDHADRIPRAAVLQHARLPPSSQDRLQVTRTHLGAALQKVLARGVEEGVFAFRDPVLAATSFMAGADAAMKTAARGEVPLSRGEAVRALLSLYENGLMRGTIAA